jgi:hypothetical protein
VASVVAVVASVVAVVATLPQAWTLPFPILTVMLTVVPTWALLAWWRSR